MSIFTFRHKFRIVFRMFCRLFVLLFVLLKLNNKQVYNSVTTEETGTTHYEDTFKQSFTNKKKNLLVINYILLLADILLLTTTMSGEFFVNYIVIFLYVGF